MRGLRKNLRPDCKVETLRSSKMKPIASVKRGVGFVRDESGRFAEEGVLNKVRNQEKNFEANLNKKLIHICFRNIKKRTTEKIRLSYQVFHACACA